MIKLDKSINLLEETRDLVLAFDKESDIFKEVDSLINQTLTNIEVKGITTVHTLGLIKSKRVHLIDISEKENVKNLDKSFKEISKLKGDILVLIDSFNKFNIKEIVSELSEKIITENYVFNELKSKKENNNNSFSFYSTTNVVEELSKGSIYGEAINNAKTLVNKPYNYLNAKSLASYALDLGKSLNLEVNIYNKKEIQELKMGAFLGVNKGSTDEPKLIYIRYQGREKWENPTALVGKGLTYDTGGYSLKSTTGMVGMKVDMAGSASVLGAIEAIARLKLKVNVMVIIAATDNRIDANAIVPDDVLTAMSGKTIEIISTDAEGRLTLADAVWFAQAKGAKEVVDIATLTGAIISALGTNYTGAFTNNKEFLEKLKSASDKTGEKIWEMPLSREHHKELKSNVADLKNKGGNYAGASIAAAFIEEFIKKDTRWIHLDIAGTATNKDKSGTGVMVKTLTKLFE